MTDKIREDLKDAFSGGRLPSASDFALLINNVLYRKDLEKELRQRRSELGLGCDPEYWRLYVDQKNNNALVVEPARGSDAESSDTPLPTQIDMRGTLGINTRIGTYGQKSAEDCSISSDDLSSRPADGTWQPLFHLPAGGSVYEIVAQIESKGISTSPQDRAGISGNGVPDTLEPVSNDKLDEDSIPAELASNDKPDEDSKPAASVSNDKPGEDIEPEDRATPLVQLQTYWKQGKRIYNGIVVWLRNFLFDKTSLDWNKSLKYFQSLFHTRSSDKAIAHAFVSIGGSGGVRVSQTTASESPRHRRWFACFLLVLALLCLLAYSLRFFQLDRCQIVDYSDKLYSPTEASSIAVAFQNAHINQSGNCALLVVSQQVEHEELKANEDLGGWVIAGFNDSGVARKRFVPNYRKALYTSLLELNDPEEKILAGVLKILGRKYVESDGCQLDVLKSDPDKEGESYKMKDACRLAIVPKGTPGEIKATVWGMDDRSEFVNKEVTDNEINGLIDFLVQKQTEIINQLVKDKQAEWYGRKSSGELRLLTNWLSDESDEIRVLQIKEEGEPKRWSTVRKLNSKMVLSTIDTDAIELASILSNENAGHREKVVYAAAEIGRTFPFSGIAELSRKLSFFKLPQNTIVDWLQKIGIFLLFVILGIKLYKLLLLPSRSIQFQVVPVDGKSLEEGPFQLEIKAKSAKKSGESEAMIRYHVTKLWG